MLLWSRLAWWSMNQFPRGWRDLFGKASPSLQGKMKASQLETIWLKSPVGNGLGFITSSTCTWNISQLINDCSASTLERRFWWKQGRHQSYCRRSIFKWNHIFIFPTNKQKYKLYFFKDILQAKKIKGGIKANTSWVTWFWYYAALLWVLLREDPERRF